MAGVISNQHNWGAALCNDANGGMIQTDLNWNLWISEYIPKMDCQLVRWYTLRRTNEQESIASNWAFLAEWSCFGARFGCKPWDLYVE